MKKSDKIINAIAKIIAKPRPWQWRMVYNTMHKINTDKKHNDLYAAWQLNKLGLLTRQHGKKIKTLIKEMRNDMFESIYESGNESFVRNFDNTTSDQRFNYVLNTLMGMHKKTSARKPAVRTSLKYLKRISNTNDESPKETNYFVNAEYNGDKKTIGFFEDGLNAKNFNILSRTIGHEYTHVLQPTNNSALSGIILDYMRRHPGAEKWVPYKIRMDEKESFLVGKNLAWETEQKFEKFMSSKDRD